MKLVGLVECVLDRGCGIAHTAEPHLRGFCGVLIQVVEPDPVDGVLRAHIGVGTRCRDSNRFHRNCEWLDRETPDLPLKHSMVRRPINLVHAPEIGLPKGKASRIKGRCALRLTRQDIQRSRCIRIADTVKARSQIDVVLSSELTRKPAQRDIARHINGLVGDIRLGGKFPITDAGHCGLDFSLCQGLAKKRYFIYHTAEIESIITLTTNGDTRFG